jgi:hypothetical protein
LTVLELVKANFWNSVLLRDHFSDF